MIDLTLNDEERMIVETVREFAANEIAPIAHDLDVNPRVPTEQIAKNSWAFRPLGLGFANLGALLMSLGLPYDSEPGRAWAAAITALMCGEAYRQSSQIASGVMISLSSERWKYASIVSFFASEPDLQSYVSRKTSFSSAPTSGS